MHLKTNKQERMIIDKCGNMTTESEWCQQIYVRPLPTLGMLDFQLEIITFSWGSGRRKCCLWDLSCLLQSKKENILYAAKIKVLNCAVICCVNERFYLTLLSTLIGFLNEPHYSLSPLFPCTVASQTSAFAVF